MLPLRGNQGLGSLIDEISLALHALDAAELRLLASGLRVRAETVITERVPHTALQWMCSD